ncbi:hypothetical protein M3Y97_00506800 [Aphelenchoides bicaudatus]|nr:hypothetical protein M3Y97_00506800 [Aphelenchoides bicaudatus]
MSSTNWMLTEKLVDEFLQVLKLEHLRSMDKAGKEKPEVDLDTLIDYEIFCTAYEKMDKDFQTKCPRTVFTYSNNGLMQTRYDDLNDNLLKFVYTFEDYYELSYCSGEFGEHREFKSWVEFVGDHVRFLLNPFNRKEIFVSEVIESELLVQLRKLCYSTLKDFQKRFRDAAVKSEYSDGYGFLVRKDFYDLNVLDDDAQQPFTPEFVERLFDVLASKQNLKGVADYRMDFRAFVQTRRMLFYSKSVTTRQLLFEIIDFNNDGFIGVDEVRHFYNGLLRMHNQIDFAGELPFARFDEFFVSWYDQMAPFDNNCSEKKLSFEQVKNHAYGDDCLMMLINYKSLMNFDRRFEMSADSDPAADTIVNEHDENVMEEENKCRDYLSDIFE